MPKKKSVSRKKKSPAKKAAGRKKAPARKAAARKAPKRKASARRSAPPRKKKTKSRAGTRPVPPSVRHQQPVPPGSEQPPQLAGEEDEHGPMHIPSHKPAPAYASMHNNDWAGKPPQSNIPIPKH